MAKLDIKVSKEIINNIIKKLNYLGYNTKIKDDNIHYEMNNIVHVIPSKNIINIARDEGNVDGVCDVMNMLHEIKREFK